MELNTRKDKLEAGLLLLSKPELGDPRFLNSVTLLCAHDQEGSWGLILNHPLPLFINANDFSIHEQPDGNKNSFPLFRGGPVGLEQCIALNKHPDSSKAPGAEEISPGLFVGKSTDTINHWHKSELLDPRVCKFFIGHAGWSFFQLDCETSNDYWFTCPGSTDTPFENPKEGLWLNCLKRLGEDFYQAGVAFLNSNQG